MPSLDSSFFQGARPIRRLGQNFLVDEAARELIVTAADLSKSDTVLEVGPGTGFLTEAIMTRAGKVIAVEKDPRLVSLLRQRYKGKRKLQIIEGDALEVKLPRFSKMVCTPPYYMSSRLVLLLVSKRFRRAVLSLQKEFAERLAAKPGTPEYGRITVMVQHKASVELAGVIGRGSFKPAPKVDSAVVVIKKKKPEIPVKNERLFQDLVRFLFTQRRKRAAKVLRSYVKALHERGGVTCETLPPLPDVRVFQLTVVDFEQLSNDIDRMRV
jgi:16S rRNA (adenine1518-N6/adenine1519-N6)-dimethyltransferase